MKRIQKLIAILAVAAAIWTTALTRVLADSSNRAAAQWMRTAVVWVRGTKQQSAMGGV
jgi:hypothetical protein